MAPGTGQAFWLSDDNVVSNPAVPLRCWKILRTLGIKRRQEAVLARRKRGLYTWRSTLGSIIIVVVSEAEASGKSDFAIRRITAHPPKGRQSKDLYILLTGQYPQET